MNWNCFSLSYPWLLKRSDITSDESHRHALLPSCMPYYPRYQSIIYRCCFAYLDNEFGDFDAEDASSSGQRIDGDMDCASNYLLYENITPIDWTSQSPSWSGLHLVCLWAFCLILCSNSFCVYISCGFGVRLMILPQFGMVLNLNPGLLSSGVFPICVILKQLKQILFLVVWWRCFKWSKVLR